MSVNAITRLTADAVEDHLYYDEDGITVGIFQTNAFGDQLAPTAAEQFIHVLQGTIKVERKDANIDEFTSGQTFAIPKGLTCRVSAAKGSKFYLMSYDDCDAAAHENVEEIGIISLNPSDAVEELTIADTSQFVGAIPKHYKHGYYTDTSGRFLVAKWDSDGFERDVAPFNRHELMIFLKGRVTLSDGQSTSETFAASDVAFVPHLAPYKWKSSEYLSKFYCIVMPGK